MLLAAGLFTRVETLQVPGTLAETYTNLQTLSMSLAVSMVS